MLMGVIVDYYGSPTPLKQMAGISFSGPENDYDLKHGQIGLKDIEKAILSSDLGFNPTNDGEVIRINIPQLTEERRKELVKIASKTGEQSKVALEMNDEMQK